MAKVARTYRGAGCPRCGETMPPSVLGQPRAYCGECGLTFEGVVFTPPERPRVVAPLPDSSDTKCARHARNAAVAACDRCGAFMCGLCRIDAEGKALCAACFERLRTAGELESATTKFRSWSTLGWHLAILGVPLMSVGILLGPVSLIASVRGIAQNKKEGIEGLGWSSAFAILLGVAVTLGGLLFALGIAGAFSGKR